MTSIEALTQFLGWSTVINVGLFVITAILLMVAHGPISGIHARMYGLSAPNVKLEYFRYVAHYKMAILMLNLVPYVSLKLMA